MEIKKNSKYEFYFYIKEYMKNQKTQNKGGGTG